MSRSLYSMLHSRFGQPLSAPERLSRIEEKLRMDRPSWRLPSIPTACIKQLKETSVAIVGAGFAGLLAARDLCRMDVRVTVFEAYKKIGGRVRSDEIFSQGRITEEGAELIGSIHTMWRELAIEYGLAWISRMDADLYTREGLELQVRFDRPLSVDELEKLYKQMTIVFKQIGRFASRIEDPSQPWSDSRLATLDKMSVADVLTKRFKIKKDGQLWKALEMLIRNNNVAPLEEMNFLGLLCLVKGGQFGKKDKDLLGYWEELEIFRCADGCQRLAIEMAAEIRKKRKENNVFLNTMVRAIDIS